MTDTKPCGCNQYKSCGRDHAGEQATTGAENSAFVLSAADSAGKSSDPLTLTVVRQRWERDQAVEVGRVEFDAAHILRAMDPDEREQALIDMSEGGYDGAETLYEAAISARLVEDHAGPFEVIWADGDLADVATEWAERNPVGDQSQRDRSAVELSGHALTALDGEEADLQLQLDKVRRRRMEIGNATAILEADEFHDDDELTLVEWSEESDDTGQFSVNLQGEAHNVIYLSGQIADDGPEWGFNRLADEDSDEPTYTMGRLREWARRTLV